jgi:hypothetical protein
LYSIAPTTNIPAIDTNSNPDKSVDVIIFLSEVEDG